METKELQITCDVGVGVWCNDCAKIDVCSTFAKNKKCTKPPAAEQCDACEDFGKQNCYWQKNVKLKNK